MTSCFKAASAADKMSVALDAELRKENQKWTRQVKILLLGPGESGKSTVFKQLKIIQEDGGFTNEELLQYKSVVYAFCITQMHTLLRGAAKQNLKFQTKENVEAALELLKVEAHRVDREVCVLIKSLWSDEGLRKLYFNEASSMYHVNETAYYFFRDMDRIMADDYIPTQDDCLRVRVRTTGIEEAVFKFDKDFFRVVDVGGQRAERRKWIHCFDCVTCVLFCASLAGYDQVLREDKDVNKMTEALDLFEDVATSNCFERATKILFLNKTDIFREKIKRVPLNSYFTGYTGGDDFDKACSFVKQRFKERLDPDSESFIHLTCALDTNNIRLVVSDVQQTILKRFTDQFVLI